MQRQNRRDRRNSGPKNNGLRRSMGYLMRNRRQALLPYLFLIVATLAQLAVPRMVRNIIDAVAEGGVAQQVLAGLDQIPDAVLGQALPPLLEALSLPADAWMSYGLDRKSVV